MANQFQSKGRRIFGFSVQGWIKGFFSGNAAISMGVIFLIFVFLVSEAVRFFPDHHRELALSRKTGQEYVDFIIREARGYQEISSLTNQAYFQELDARFGVERGLVEGFEVLQEMIEDGAESEIEALAEAREATDPVASSAAEKLYWAKSGELVDGADRSVVDSFGRLSTDDSNWQKLLQVARSYDAVEEETPDLISAAEAEMESGMAKFREAKMLISSAGSDLKRLRDRLVEIASATRKEVQIDRSLGMRRKALLEGAEKLQGKARDEQLAEAEALEVREQFPFEKRVQPILDAHGEHQKAADDLKKKLREGIAALPGEYSSEASRKLVAKIRQAGPVYLKALDESLEASTKWSWNEKVSWGSSVSRFFLGEEWKTASGGWRQLYGFLPLFTGSVTISIIALCFAVPFSIGAAIYVNQLSSKWEQAFMKPAIEMIQAIPSIVLGFFGIMVLGSMLVEYSDSPWVSWLPGFPITERLNMLNAGMLLALMAIPTIFTLCEDALNNVPRSFSEASLALGASRFQTLQRVVVPAASSGILAAVLLGLGRIIGETMVVLLVAGNRIAMPDWGDGLGIITQPSHTMTGIIAQEMGEVTVGTLHYRSLFLIGLVLFVISLLINLAAQKIIKRLGADV
jgi:phosphate transport system permease protein